jgi:hypothetical protein
MQDLPNSTCGILPGKAINEKQHMNSLKKTGYLFLFGALGVFLPYLVLSFQFDYPDILRKDGATILRRFQAGGNPIIFTWLLFAWSAMPLIMAYYRIGKWLEPHHATASWITHIGMVSGWVQVLGLLRWVFVVPMLADAFTNTTDPARQQAILVAFELIHQAGGVLLGEHAGQLLTVIWTATISIMLFRSGLIPKWVMRLGQAAAAIYLLAQAELLATVVPGFPYWEPAGFVGSTLWLAWLVIIGWHFIRLRQVVLPKNAHS